MKRMWCLSISALLVMLLAMPVGLEAASGKTNAREITVELLPSATFVTVGSAFTVDIQVKAGRQPISVIDTFINFDPEFLEVTSITPQKEKLNATLNLITDNQLGHADFSAGNILKPATGTFTIATITFKKLRETEGTSISLNEALPRQTLAAYEDNTISTKTTACTISSATEIAAELLPSATFVTVDSTFTVDIRVKAGDQPISAIDTFIDFDPEVLKVTGIKHQKEKLNSMSRRILDNKLGHADFRASNSRTPATDTFTIATVTFKLLKETEGTSISISKASPRKTIATYKNSPISTRTTACTIISEEETTLPLNQSKAIMKLVPSNTTVSAGATFTVDVVAENISQPRTAIDTFIDFDPTALQVARIDVNNSRARRDLDKINATGDIDFSVVNSLPDSNNVLSIATITFISLKGEGKANISFSRAIPRKTDIAWHGESILWKTKNCTIKLVNKKS